MVLVAELRCPAPTARAQAAASTAWLLRLLLLLTLPLLAHLLLSLLLLAGVQWLGWLAPPSVCSNALTTVLVRLLCLPMASARLAWECGTSAEGVLEPSAGREL